jgi:hypothetical protein
MQQEINNNVQKGYLHIKRSELTIVPGVWNFKAIFSLQSM